MTATDSSILNDTPLCSSQESPHVTEMLPGLWHIADTLTDTRTVQNNPEPGTGRSSRMRSRRVKKEISCVCFMVYLCKLKVPRPLSNTHYFSLCLCLILSYTRAQTHTETDTTYVSPQTPYPQFACQVGCHSIPISHIMTALLFRFMTQNRGKEHAVLLSKARQWQRAQISTSVFLLSDTLCLGGF